MKASVHFLKTETNVLENVTKNDPINLLLLLLLRQLFDG